MTRYFHPQSAESTRKRSADSSSIGGGLLFVLAAMGLLVAISYPLTVAAAVGAVAVAALVFRLGAPALARELHGRMTELEVPGIGTVRIRVDGR
ncbi:hypothetical protein [Natronococcus sp. A-GB7]|uniref:hypothetical protein n=1 Tax=Natronococcus sp. A-GB7 TaxID=3037649 RepID=UPI00241D9FB2|nr:hypothetical protein [Natronococcus sp. A-GB7]MDG5818056.1 hypothetical protein [Natronococcus sp. A-GB7]